MQLGKFKTVDNKVDFVQIEHDILKKWDDDATFDRLREKNIKISYFDE